MRWIPADSMSCACTGECGVPEDSIWRVTEREVFRRNTESEGQSEHGRSKKTTQNISGGDALMGHTRSHPEHDG